MKKRLILLAGLGVGFVLGSRAGRQSYEKLKAQVEDWWQDPRVQDSVHRAADTVREQTPIVAEKVQSAASSAMSAVQAKVGEMTDKSQEDDVEELDDVEVLDDVVSDPETAMEAEGPAVDDEDDDEDPETRV